MSSDVEVLRRFRLTPRATDIAVAATVSVASVVNVANQDTTGMEGIPTLGFVMLAVAGIALLWRRTQSVGVLGVALVMVVIWALAGYPSNPVFHMLAALYAIGRYLTATRLSLLALGVSLAVATTIQVADGDPVSEIAVVGLVTVLPWYVGRRVRIRGLYADAVRRQRATEAQRAVNDARSAIARELHDVVAHNVSVMTVQAGVARLVVADDPGRAQQAIREVEEAGRLALDELRHLLGVLRPATGSDSLEPQPALHQIDHLVGRLEQTGMQIALSMEVASDLPVRVDLFGYRIVQEALTNVLKHAGVDSSTNVRLEEIGDRLVIEVINSGAATDALPGSGRGIVGMEERASLLGGSFEAGPRPDGGFRVFVSLPIGAE
jgi:signal transduction histidine kinase